MSQPRSRKTAEAVLGQHPLEDAPVRHLLSSIPDAVVIANAAGRIVFANRLAEEMFGYGPDDLAGQPLSSLIPERFRRAHTKHVARFGAAPQARPMGLEKAGLMGLRSDGSEFPVDISLSFFETPSGRVAFAAVRDITAQKEYQIALRQSEERYRDYYEQAPLAYMSIDPASGKILECNMTTTQMLGVPKSAIIGRSVADFYTEESGGAAIAATEQAIKKGQVRGVDLQIRRSDGETIDVTLDSTVVFSADGHARLTHSTWRDITEQKQTQRALEASEAKYRSIFENIPDIYYQTDAIGIILEISPAVERYAYTREGLIGTSVLEVYEDPDQRAELIKAILQDGEVSDFPLRIKTGDGRTVDFSLNARARLAADGTLAGTEGVLRDISERRRMEASLEHALHVTQERARRDPLTGVLNHAAIVEKLREATLNLGSHQSHAIAMVDVDGLKAINDTFGHITGDEVLVAAVKALSQDDAEVGRYGGDEFVVLLAGADRDAAEQYKEQVMADLESRVVSDSDGGATVPVTVSIGFTIFPEDAGSIEDILDASDTAMYAAKRQRSLLTDGEVTPQPMDDEQAARMIGQIVPLLTTPGKLEEKLRRASQALSTIAGYDGVDFTFFAPQPGTPIAQQAFADVDQEALQEWIEQQRSPGDEPHPIRALLERTRRPVIIDNMEIEERITEPQRSWLIEAGIRSGLVVPMIWHNGLIGSLSVGSKQRSAFSARDAQFLTSVATQITAIMQMDVMVEELQVATAGLSHAQEETVILLAGAAEAHDRTTGLHLQSVRALATKLAQEMGYSDEDADAIGLASVLHDIGKIRVPDTILTTPGKLDSEQWDIMKQHTIWGASFLSGHSGFELAASIARSHHERWDGAGYPDNLSGDDIPEAATIVTVADAFDAMTHDRPYRASQPVDEAIEEIAKYAGKQFNPKVVDALQRLVASGTILQADSATPDTKAA